MSKRSVALVLGIICVVLFAGLSGAIGYYSIEVGSKDSTIADQESTIFNQKTQLAENEQTIVSLNAKVLEQDLQVENLTSQNVHLQAWLDGNVTFYNNQLTDLKNQLSELQNQLENLTLQLTTLQNQAYLDQATISSLETQIEASSAQIASLQNQSLADQATIAHLQMEIEEALSLSNLTLQNEIDMLKAIINLESSELQTLVFHVCEKEWLEIPDVEYIYNQTLLLSSGRYNVLLLPEYKQHLNWTEEFLWLNTSFGGPYGIPIMLEAFGSSEDGDPIIMLSIEQILNAMKACNVKYLRISEVISWHIEHQQPFPYSHLISLLNFCRANGLKVFWTEWKTDYLPNVEVFTAIQNHIKGYEDIVTVSFSTNSEELEPGAGFLQVSGIFQHVGASVQAWYWDTRYDNLLAMPPSLLVEHALAAKNIGAEIIQFEPYWYFFEDGQANDNLKLLLAMLR